MVELVIGTKAFRGQVLRLTDCMHPHKTIALGGRLHIQGYRLVKPR